MKLTFLGTGTSTGVPMIACDCAVCSSTDPHNRRRRTSVYVEAAATRVVIDTPPDFREQALAYRIPRVDAVLVTHSHADHILGMDDIRRYNTIQQSVIPVYASPGSRRDLMKIFDYVLHPSIPPGTYRPELNFVEVVAPFQLGDMAVTPLAVAHGAADALGFHIAAEDRTLGYVPDCHDMSDQVVQKLAGVDVMVLDAVRYRPHATHLTVDESLTLLRRIGARRSFLIHMCHDLDHETVRKSLPPSVEISYDGLVLEW